jgi:hypothetical protein
MEGNAYVMAARVAMGLMYAGSSAQKLLPGGEHPLMGGTGKLYPGWFLPVAAALHELAIVALLARGEDGPAVLGSCLFIGGLIYTNLDPFCGAIWKKGRKAAMPSCMVATVTMTIYRDIPHPPNESPSMVFEMMKKTDLKGLLNVARSPPLWILTICILVGAFVGAMLANVFQHVPGVSEPAKPARPGSADDMPKID